MIIWFMMIIMSVGMCIDDIILGSIRGGCIDILLL